MAWRAGIRILVFIKTIKDPAQAAFSTPSSDSFGLARMVVAKWEGVFGTNPEPLPDQME